MMEFSSRFFRVKSLGRYLLVSLILTISSTYVSAQTGPRIDPKPTSSPLSATQPGDSSTRPSADETFELNIVERHYSQENFEASTAVGTGSDDQKLNLNVGVALSAGRIDALLRNVHGTVRFRGSLGRILGIVGDRLTPSPAASPAPTP
jgi:hypothetical protein